MIIERISNNISNLSTILKPQIEKKPDIIKFDKAGSDIKIRNFHISFNKKSSLPYIFLKNDLFDKNLIEGRINEIKSKNNSFNSTLNVDKNLMNFKPDINFESNKFQQYNLEIINKPKKDIYEFSIDDSTYSSSSSFSINEENINFEDINSEADLVNYITENFDNIDLSYNFNSNKYNLNSYNNISIIDDNNELNNLTHIQNQEVGIIKYDNKNYYSTNGIFEINDNVKISNPNKLEEKEYILKPKLNVENIKSKINNYVDKYNNLIKEINENLKFNFSFFDNNFLEDIKLKSEKYISQNNKEIGIYQLKKRVNYNEANILFSNNNLYESINIEDKDSIKNLGNSLKNIGIINLEDGSLIFDEDSFNNNLEDEGENNIYTNLSDLLSNSQTFSEDLQMGLERKLFLLDQLSKESITDQNQNYKEAYSKKFEKSNLDFLV